MSQNVSLLRTSDLRQRNNVSVLVIYHCYSCFEFSALILKTHYSILYTSEADLSSILIVNFHVKHLSDIGKPIYCYTVHVQLFNIIFVYSLNDSFCENKTIKIGSNNIYFIHISRVYKVLTGLIYYNFPV